MDPAMHVAVDLEAGLVRLGSERVRLHPAAAPDAFQVGDDRGPVLRPLTFGERTLLLFGTPPSGIAARVAAAALLACGDAPETEALRVAVSLALAGGAEDAPAFSECASLALRQDGWDERRVREAPALVVDRLSRREDRPPPEDGWNRFVFPAPEPDLDALVSRMVENLCARSASPAGEAAPRQAPGPVSQPASPRPRFSFRLEPDRVDARGGGSTGLDRDGGRARHVRRAARDRRCARFDFTCTAVADDIVPHAGPATLRRGHPRVRHGRARRLAEAGHARLGGEGREPARSAAGRPPRVGHPPCPAGPGAHGRVGAHGHRADREDAGTPAPSRMARVSPAAHRTAAVGRLRGGLSVRAPALPAAPARGDVAGNDPRHRGRPRIPVDA